MKKYFYWPVLLIGLYSGMLYAAPPKLVVTLKPLHSLVSGLTAGISQPDLLIQGSQSPHDYQLRPSERRMLESADIVIYASDSVESFMVPLHRAIGNKPVIELVRIPGLDALPARDMDGHGGHGAEDLDGHVWLSTHNARVIVEYLCKWLVSHDEANKQGYTANRDRMLAKIDQLRTSIQQKVDSVHSMPFIQFHDALQYFEQEFGFDNGLFVTTGADHAPGARHVQYLQQQVQSKNIQCFFYEPPQIPKLVNTLDVNKQARKLPLDIHGTQFKAGEQLYFDLLEYVAGQMHKCLAGDNAGKNNA